MQDLDPAPAEDRGRAIGLGVPGKDVLGSYRQARNRRRLAPATRSR